MGGKCPHCGRQLVPLFTTFYCPNDCDRPEATRKREEVAKKTAEEETCPGFGTHVWTSWGWGATRYSICPNCGKIKT